MDNPQHNSEKEIAPQQPNQSEQESQEKPRHGKNALEWSIFALSLVLVLGVVSFLGIEALQGGANPPRLEVKLGEPVKAGDRILVPVEVDNRGDATAAGVEVEVSRRQSDEKASFSFAHVPRGGHRRGWVAFDAPLQKKELDAQIIGYEEP